MAPRKLIIDTDPVIHRVEAESPSLLRLLINLQGVDDVLAMLLALSALPEEVEVLLLSVTYGNVDVQNCLRNVISLFYHIEKEIAWRQRNGKALGFDTLRNHKPLIAVGPEHPLDDQILMADFFHGKDGLGGVHDSHPHLSPTDTWKQLFTHAETSGDAAEATIAMELQKTDTLFTPSKRPASEEILRLLRENEPDTITVVAIGPLTNLALAAAADPEAFLRAKEVVIMGGNLNEHGNITPVAEFNTFADAVAAARIYALSSPQPRSTMPPSPPLSGGSEARPSVLGPYPASLSRQMKLTLFTLDITNYHNVTRGIFHKVSEPLLREQSPLAEWMSAFLGATLNKIETLQKDVSGDAVALELHDPLTIWYCMTDPSTWKLSEEVDIRVETSGQWTRGLTLLDRRPRKKRAPGDDGERPGDTGNWLSLTSGNRIRYAVDSPGRGRETFGQFMLERIFAL